MYSQTENTMETRDIVIWDCVLGDLGEWKIHWTGLCRDHVRMQSHSLLTSGKKSVLAGVQREDGTHRARGF